MYPEQETIIFNCKTECGKLAFKNARDFTHILLENATVRSHARHKLQCLQYGGISVTKFNTQYLK